MVSKRAVFLKGVWFHTFMRHVQYKVIDVDDVRLPGCEVQDLQWLCRPPTSARRRDLRVRQESASMAWARGFYALAQGLSPGDRIITSMVEYGANYVAMLQARVEASSERNYIHERVESPHRCRVVALC